MMSNIPRQAVQADPTCCPTSPNKLFKRILHVVQHPPTNCSSESYMLSNIPQQVVQADHTCCPTSPNKLFKRILHVVASSGVGSTHWIRPFSRTFTLLSFILRVFRKNISNKNVRTCETLRLTKSGRNRQSSRALAAIQAS